MPENSPSAFAEAMARGLAIECDVQRTGDGQAAVFHDWELDRLTDERGPVIRRPLAEIERIALAGSSDRVPSLERMLAQIGGRVPVLIELKSKRERRVAPLCLAVRRALDGYRGPHAVMSFDPRVSRWFSVHAPRTVRGLVVTEEDDKGVVGLWRRHAALWHARPDFLAYDVRDLPSRFAAGQRKRGIPVLTWTVRSPELRERAALHADAPIAEGDGLA
ncbi:glycerophosphodiester phosphodiesterase family protein [Pelagerythrobacter aerophilus]